MGSKLYVMGTGATLTFLVPSPEFAELRIHPDRTLEAKVHGLLEQKGVTFPQECIMVTQRNACQAYLKTEPWTGTEHK